MSIFSAIAKLWDDVWDEIKEFFVEDVQPAVESFLKQFASDEGQMILQAALAAAPKPATHKFGDVVEEVVKTVIAQSAVIAAQNVAETLGQVQSAMQIAKVSEGVLSTSDAALVAKVADDTGAPVSGGTSAVPAPAAEGSAA